MGKCVFHNGGFYLWGKCVIHNGGFYLRGGFYLWGKCVIHNFTYGGRILLMGQMCNS